MKHKGLRAHRLKDNPEERRFARAWEQSQELSSTLAHLLDERPVQGGAAPKVRARDGAVAATIIQWLGSPVGQNFLKDLGYTRVPDRSRPWELLPRERERAALDIMYDEVDRRLTAGRFAEVDEILRESDPWKLSVTLALGLLSISFAAKDKLKERADYYRRTRKRLKETDHDRADDLLHGLQ